MGGNLRSKSARPTAVAIHARCLVLAIGLTACDDLPQVRLGVCGNAIVERGEACDGANVGENECTAGCQLRCAGRLCPEGYGCGADGMCRAPTGQFVSLGGFAIESANLSLTDFDGDGRLDVLAHSPDAFSIAYMVGRTLVKGSGPIFLDSEEQISLYPTADDVNGDGMADVLFPIQQGAGLYTVLPGRELQPHGFPYPIPEMMGAAELLVADFRPGPDYPGDEIIAYSKTTGKLTYIDPASGSTLDLYQMPGASVTVGRVIGADDGSPGLDIVLAQSGSSSVFVFEPVATGPGNTPQWNENAAVQPLSEVTLPPGVTVSGAALVAKLSLAEPGGPGDLLIPVTGGPDKLYFAIHAGQRQFYPAPGGQGPPGRAAPFHANVIGQGEAGALLNAGFINGDGFIDFVDQGGILLSACSSDCTLKPADPMDPVSGAVAWFERVVTAELEPGAKILPHSPDLGARGDIIAWRSSGDLGFFRYLDNHVMHEINLATSDGPRDISTGDFNGDGVLDVAFIQPARTGNKAFTRSLHVALGDAFGIPGEPTWVDTLPPKVGVSAGRLDWLPSGEDALTDLLTYPVMGPKMASVHPYTGSDEAPMVAPLLVPKACGQEHEAVVMAALIAPGFLDGGGEQGGNPPQLALFTVRPDQPGLSLWSVSADEDDLDAMCASLDGPVALPGFEDFHHGGKTPSFLAVDLDGDQRQEMVVLALQPAPKVLIAKAGVGAGSGFTLTTVELDGFPYSGMLKIPVAPPAGGMSLKPQNDVMLFGLDEMTRTFQALLLKKNGAALDLSGARKLTKALPTGSPSCDCSGNMEYDDCGGVSGAFTMTLDVAALNTDADADYELAVQIGAGMLILDQPPGGQSGELHCLSAVLAGGTSVAAGDMDQDGVDDLLVSRGPTLELLLGVSETP